MIGVVKSCLYHNHSPMMPSECFRNKLQIELVGGPEEEYLLCAFLVKEKYVGLVWTDALTLLKMISDSHPFRALYVAHSMRACNWDI